MSLLDNQCCSQRHRKPLAVYPEEHLAKLYLRDHDNAFKGELRKFLADKRLMRGLAEYQYDELIEALKKPESQRDAGRVLLAFYRHKNLTPKVPTERGERLTQAVRDILEAGYDGVFIVIDEMSEYLRRSQCLGDDEDCLQFISEELAQSRALEAAQNTLAKITDGQLARPQNRARAERILNTLFLYHLAGVAGLNKEQILDAVSDLKPSEDQLQAQLGHYETILEEMRGKLRNQIRYQGGRYEFIPKETSQYDDLVSQANDRLKADQQLLWQKIDRLMVYAEPKAPSPFAVSRTSRTSRQEGSHGARVAVDRSKGRALYAGWNIVWQLSHGSVRTLLEIVEEIFRDAGVSADSPSVSLESQDTSVRNYSVRKYKALSLLPGTVNGKPLGEGLQEVLSAIGEISRQYLTRWKSGSPDRWYEAISIERNDRRGIGQEAIAVLQELLTYDLLLDDGVTFSRTQIGLGVRYDMNKVFAPAFQTTYRVRNHLYVSQEKFRELLLKPSQFVKRHAKKLAVLATPAKSKRQRTLFDEE
jgi:hypothetical protein